MNYKIQNIEKDAKEKLLFISPEPEKLILDHLDKNNEFQWLLLNNTGETTVSIFTLDIMPEQILYVFFALKKEETSIVVLSEIDANNNPVMLELINEYNLRRNN